MALRCTPKRKLAHHWLIGEAEVGKWAWGRCRWCRRRRLFEVPLPRTANHELNRKARERAQRNALRRERKANR